MTNLTDLINKTIENAYIVNDVELDYQIAFLNEGERKARYIIDDLNYRASRDKFDLQDLCFLSVGGADGSEIEKVLIDTHIKYGILVEINEWGAKKAREKAVELKAKFGKELTVIQGDAFDTLDVCLRTIRHYILINAVNGLIVSVQAVLHELPRRSKNYDSVLFFGKLYGDPALRNCLLYSREPCKPQGWPERVRIKVKGVKNDDLYRFACHVRDRLQIKGTPEKLASNWLDIESDLAIETLHKLLRNDTVNRIEYELGEQLTEFDPIALKRNLESCIEGMKISFEYITTLGFKRALTDNKVDFVGHNSEELPFPRTHVEIVGVKIVKATNHYYLGNPISIPYTPQQKQTALANSIDKRNLIPGNFKNVFDGDISNQKIIDFLVQFEAEEIPILLKVIEHFNYVNLRTLEEHCRTLYGHVLELYKDNIENVVFVPLGKSSKSSGLVSYFFRTVNNIEEQKFLSSDKLT